ncbi:septum formation initiator [Saccharopolyspora rhizosphaerae]|uniref:Septum formation initiator n=1 Tax=Saccharopolyspora rhizosphaerae TaxID=2492662 RepID=A0A426JVT1_9PSEU|nr:septum site-determining protein Ssd [Saccharopolyspora rhizosphaerae]RRO17223.1 septum formation initiator [Saccharopolyspora rhizosphaerae]
MFAAQPPTPENAHPLLVVRDAELAEEVTRLAAASGSELERAPRLLPTAWRTAPLVLLDEPTAVTCADRALPRRRGVALVCRATDESVWRTAFGIGAERVLTLPADEPELIELLADAVDAPVGEGRVLAVLGGCGGAGASALATAASVVAARSGGRSLLVDCDPLGGGLDLALGLEREEGLRWSGLSVGAGRLGSATLRRALPKKRVGPGELAVLACDRDRPPSGLTPEGVRAVLGAGRRSGATVVCDLPRSPSSADGPVLGDAELAVVVVPAEVRACAAAARVVSAVTERAGCPVRLVVRGPSPGGLRPRDVARAAGAPVLATMRPQPRLAAAVDRGDLVSAAHRRSPLATAADAALTELAAVESPTRR